ncbi:hypothetical protein [Marinicauda algicola]|nr:hypothetical protein [Marinicauda algicola]
MRGFLIGIVALTLIVLGGFGVLLLMAEGLAPEPHEVRIEVTDELGS